MAKKYSDEPDDRMEAPCRCNCGNWFDLDDGYMCLINNSNVVCEECHETQEEEKEREEEIDELKTTLANAEWEIKDCRKQLQTYGVKLPDESSLLSENKRLKEALGEIVKYIEDTGGQYVSQIESIAKQALKTEIK